MLVEVNVAGEEGKSGVAPAELDAFLERCPVPVAGLMTMPPLAARPEDSRRWFAALRELAERRGLRELSMGTTQDYEVAVEEGATIVRIGTTPVRAELCRRNGRRGLTFERPWRSATAGIARSSTSASPRSARTSTSTRGARAHERASASARERPRRRPSPRPRSRTATASARTSAGSRRAAGAATTSTTSSPTTSRAAPPPDDRAAAGRARPRNGGDVRVHLVIPKSFNDAQQVADKFKDAIPVVLNLQGDRHRPRQAPDRLRQRPDLRARRRHAADRRQGLHAHAAQRRRSPPRSAPS